MKNLNNKGGRLCCSEFFSPKCEIFLTAQIFKNYKINTNQTIELLGNSYQVHYTDFYTDNNIKISQNICWICQKHTLNTGVFCKNSHRHTIICEIKTQLQTHVRPADKLRSKIWLSISFKLKRGDGKDIHTFLHLDSVRP